MNFIQKWAGLVALVILAIGALVPNVSHVFGATSTGPTHWSLETFMQGLQIGQNGSVVTQLVKGTCNLIGTNSSQAASTTVAYDCAASGVKSGDIVFAKLASSTPTSYGGWNIVASLASTTSGYFTVLLYNGTGAAAIPSVTAVGSSTQYEALR